MSESFHSLIKLYSFTDTIPSSKPGYLIVAIAAVTAVVVVVVTVVVIICFLRVRRKHRQRHKEQASSHVEMKTKEECISLNNPA